MACYKVHHGQGSYHPTDNNHRGYTPRCRRLRPGLLCHRSLHPCSLRWRCIHTCDQILHVHRWDECLDSCHCYPTLRIPLFCLSVTVKAVVVGRDVTNRIVTSALVVGCAPRILNAPAAIVAMVAIRTVAVFNALRRTFVIDAGLPRETIARSWGVSTVASIVNGPDAGGALWPEVVLVVEGVCP